MNFIANTYDFESILLTPTENIEKKALKSYIFTSLELKNIDIENKKIFYTYLFKTNTYQIFITDTKFDTFVFELLYSKLNKDTKDTKDTKLFICDEFFTLFIDNSFYYYKRLSHKIDTNDIKDFVQKKLKVEYFSTLYIKEEELNELANIEINKKSKSKSKLKSIYKTNKAIYLYFIYLFLLVTIVSGYIFYEKNKIQNRYKKDTEAYLLKLEKAKEDIKFFYLSSRVDNFLKNIEKNGIKIERLSYDSRLMKFVLVSKSSKNINRFILDNKEFIKVNKIENNLKNGFVRFSK